MKKDVYMKTWWDELLKDGKIKILECDWCHDEAILYDTGLSHVCENCLKSEEYFDEESSLTSEERNA